jgi:hypothetical protein
MHKKFLTPFWSRLTINTVWQEGRSVKDVQSRIEAHLVVITLKQPKFRWASRYKGDSHSQWTVTYKNKIAKGDGTLDEVTHVRAAKCCSLHSAATKKVYRKMIVDPEALKKFSGLTRSADVCRWLEKNGVQFLIQPSGRPTTTLDAINRALFGDPNKKNQQPNWDPFPCSPKKFTRKTAATTTSTRTNGTS